MSKEKQKKSLNIWQVMIIIIVVVFVLFMANRYMTNELIEEEDIEEEAGLYDKVGVGDLSFDLWEVELFARKGRENNSISYHTMWWKYEVTNEGDTIKSVSNCGSLLFEDGSQYDFQVGYPGDYTMVDCNYFDLVPGAKMPVWYGFKFYSNSGRYWEEVPGSKITFFSQQDSGLVKSTIDKSEIEYTYSP